MAFMSEEFTNQGSISNIPEFYFQVISTSGQQLPVRAHNHRTNPALVSFHRFNRRRLLGRRRPPDQASVVATRDQRFPIGMENKAMNPAFMSDKLGLGPGCQFPPNDLVVFSPCKNIASRRIETASNKRGRVCQWLDDMSLHGISRHRGTLQAEGRDG